MIRAVVAALLLAVAAEPVIAPTPNRPATVAVPASIDASGSVDVTDALNRFLAGVPDGSVVELIPQATYRVEGTLELSERRDLVLDGQGAKLFATTEGARDRSHLSIEESSGIVVRDLVIEGAHPNGGTGEGAWRPDKAFQHGIAIGGGRDVELDRVTVTDVFGDLVYVGSSEGGTWSEDVWIHDSILTRNGRQGIALVAARDVVIERNVIADTRRATIDLEPGTPAFGAINVHIIENAIGPGRLRFVAAHGGGDVSEVVVARNVLHGRDLAIDIEPPEGERRSGFWVIDNRSDHVAEGGPLRFTRLDGVVVRGNSQPVDPRRPAITADSVCGLEVEDNNFPGAARVVAQVGRACRAPVVGAQAPPPPALEGRTSDAADGQAPVDDDGSGAGEPGPADRPPQDRPEEEAADGPPRSGAERLTLGLTVALALVVVSLLAWRRRRRRHQHGRPGRPPSRPRRTATDR